VIGIGGGASRAGEFILGPARKEVQLRARSPFARPRRDKGDYPRTGIRRAGRSCASPGRRRGVRAGSFQARGEKVEVDAVSRHIGERMRQIADGDGINEGLARRLAGRIYAR
jgi:hypothetical protein